MDLGCHSGPSFSGTSSPEVGSMETDLRVQPAWHEVGRPRARRWVCSHVVLRDVLVSQAPCHGPLDLRPRISSASWGSLPAHPLTVGVTQAPERGVHMPWALHSQHGAEGSGSQGRFPQKHSHLPLPLGPFLATATYPWCSLSSTEGTNSPRPVFTSPHPALP